MKRMSLMLGVAGLALGLAAAGARADQFTGYSLLQGSATLQPTGGPGGAAAIQLTTGALPSGSYSNIIWQPTDDFTLAQLTNLTVTFQGTSDSVISPGSPRIAFWFDWNGNGVLLPGWQNGTDGATHVFAYFPSPTVQNTTYAATPNLTTSNNWDTTQAGGSEPVSFTSVLSTTYEGPVTEYDGIALDNLRVLAIGIVMDAGEYDTTQNQQILVDNVEIQGLTGPISTDGSVAPASVGTFTDYLVAQPAGAVPEPATVGLLVLGGAMLLVRRRRRVG